MSAAASELVIKYRQDLMLLAMNLLKIDMNKEPNKVQQQRIDIVSKKTADTLAKILIKMNET